MMLPPPKPQKDPASDSTSLTKASAPGLDARALLSGVPDAQDLLAALPLIDRWIDQTLANHAADTRPLASLGFANLGRYFPEEFLKRAKVAVVDQVPLPPLDKLGLDSLAATMPAQPAGITYKDTFFVQRQYRADESLHFHEAIHVAQWEQLGAEGFLALYAIGLARFGYRHSPLEETAYNLQGLFDAGGQPFDATVMVEGDLRKLLASL